MKIKLLVDAGAMKPGPGLSQKLGPLGINIGKVIAEINNSTKSFEGMKVPVELDVDVKTKEFKIEVKTPPTSELLKRELGIPKGSPLPAKLKVGNAALEQLIKIAKLKRKDMFVASLKKALYTVLGTCASLGVLVESKPAQEVKEEIKQGKWDELIKSESEKAPPEKLKRLAEDFAVIKKQQEALEKELAAKAAAMPGTGTATASEETATA